MIVGAVIPHFIKYMGSKREILTDISDVVDALKINSDWFCDLFAGTSIVSYAMSDKYNIISNDIQQYSSVFAKTYFGSYDFKGSISELVSNILENALGYINGLNDQYPFLRDILLYPDDIAYDDFVSMEGAQRELVNADLNWDFTLFTRCYSGTYWSLEQCEWIDALRRTAEDYKTNSLYYAILSSIIFAMSYSSQSTGHFAQYRKITKTNYKNILLYRRRSIPDLFARKLEEILTICNGRASTGCIFWSLDYRDCLKRIPDGTLVYADPP